MAEPLENCQKCHGTGQVYQGHYDYAQEGQPWVDDYTPCWCTWRVTEKTSLDINRYSQGSPDNSPATMS